MDNYLTITLFKIKRTKEGVFRFGYKVDGNLIMMHEYVRWLQEQPWSKKGWNYQEPQYWTLYPNTNKKVVKLFRGGKYGWYTEGCWKHFGTKMRKEIHRTFIRKVEKVWSKVQDREHIT